MELTESEVRYLVEHDDAESVRNRILAAGNQAGNERDAGVSPRSSRSGSTETDLNKLVIQQTPRLNCWPCRTGELCHQVHILGGVHRRARGTKTRPFAGQANPGHIPSGASRRTRSNPKSVLMLCWQRQKAKTQSDICGCWGYTCTIRSLLTPDTRGFRCVGAICVTRSGTIGFHIIVLSALRAYRQPRQRRCWASASTAGESSPPYPWGQSDSSVARTRRHPHSLTLHTVRAPCASRCVTSRSKASCKRSTRLTGRSWACCVLVRCVTASSLACQPPAGTGSGSSLRW